MNIKSSIKKYLLIPILSFLVSNSIWASTSLMLPLGHSGQIIELRVSQDNQYISTLDTNNKIIIWDKKTRKQLIERQLSKGKVSLSPFGQFAAYARTDKIIILDLASNKVLHEIKILSLTNIGQIYWFANGKKILIRRINDYQIININSKYTEQTFEDKLTNKTLQRKELIFPVKGDIFLRYAPEYNFLEKFNTKTGTVSNKQFVHPTESGITEAILCHKDSVLITVVKNSLYIWDFPKQLLLKTIKRPNKIRAIGCGTTGDSILTVEDDAKAKYAHVLSRFDIKSTNKLLSLEKHYLTNIKLLYNKVSNEVFMISLTEFYTLDPKTLKLNKQKYTGLSQNFSRVNTRLKLTQNNKLIFLPDTDKARQYDIDNNLWEKIEIDNKNSTVGIKQLFFDHQTKIIMSVNEHIKTKAGRSSRFGNRFIVFDLESNKLIDTFQANNFSDNVWGSTNNPSLRSLAISTDEKWLASYYDKENKIFIYSIPQKKVIYTLDLNKAHKKVGKIKKMVFTKNNEQLYILRNTLSYSSNFLLDNWDIKKQQLQKTYTGDIKSRHYLPGLANARTFNLIQQDKQILLAASGNVKLVDIKKQSLVKKFAITNSVADYLQVFSNQTKAIIGLSNGDIYLLDLVAGKIIQRFTGHKNNVTDIIFTKNKQFLSISKDGTVRLWSLKTGKTLAILFMQDTDNWAVITPDGYFDKSEKFNAMYWVSDLQAFGLDQLYDDFYIPNLLSLLLNPKTKLKKTGNKKLDLLLSQAPPIVKIMSPSGLRGIKLLNKKSQIPLFHNKFVDVQVKVNSNDSIVSQVSLYHNGKLVEKINPVKDNIPLNNKKDGALLYTFKLRLIKGKNQIKAMAKNSNNIDSLPDEISIRYVQEEAVKPDLYAVVVGLNKYKNKSLNLNYGRPDASAFSKLIKTKFSSLFKQINIVALYDDEADKNSINHALNNVIKKAKAEDVFIFYFAGHGVMLDETQDKGDYFLIPYDVINPTQDKHLFSSAISAKQLTDFSRKIAARKQLLLFDACQSGGMQHEFSLRGFAEQKALKQLSRSAGIFLISASQSDQFASEFKQLGHGVFTYGLLKGLGGIADGSPKDGKTTVRELSAYLENEIPNLSEKYRGQAQYPTTYGRGQDFPLLVH
jgi:WD40 repeat protein